MALRGRLAVGDLYQSSHLVSHLEMAILRQFLAEYVNSLLRLTCELFHTEKCWYIFPQKLLWPLCFVNSARRLVWPLYSNICTVISSINIFLNGKLIWSKMTLCNSANSQHHLKIQQFSTCFFTCKAVTICADEDSLSALNFTSLVEEILLTKSCSGFQAITVFQHHLSFHAWEMPFKFIDPWGMMDFTVSLILSWWGRHKSCV